MNDARRTILDAIRAGTSTDAAPPLPPVWSRAEASEHDRGERFAAMLTQVGGACATIADLATAAAHIDALLRAAGATSLAVSDAAAVQQIVPLLATGPRVLPPDAPRNDLLLADAGLTMAQWGIAETGTVVLEAAAERHRLASLLPALHIVLLPRSRLLGTLGQAFARLQQEGGPPTARTITFITGPSRTADIELELVVGVHGPKSLHVLLLDSA